MKRFFIKLSIILALFAAVNIILLFVVPVDRNAYLAEYNKKVELIEATGRLRIIFIGGSNLAFGLDSKAIQDSLHRNVINMGLHAGIGIRYLLDDYLPYMREGDIAVLQMEYQHFYSLGNGEPETLTGLMLSTNWRNFGRLNRRQLFHVITGIPYCVHSNLSRLLRYPFRKSFDSPAENKVYRYVASGFNEYGDEASHWTYPREPNIAGRRRSDRTVDRRFVEWLAGMLQEYEQRGAEIVMVPPVSPFSNFIDSYDEAIGTSLRRIGRQYVCDPVYMTVDDSCSFNGGYHVTWEGVMQNTGKIISILSDFCKTSGAAEK